MNIMIVEELNNMKYAIDYDDVYNRLISYIDSLNLLSYIRDDVQFLDGKKLFFRSIGIKCNGIDSAMNIDPENAYRNKSKAIYISTQVSNDVAEDRDELSKVFCKLYVEKMKDHSFFRNYPDSLKSLAANSVEELSLKIGIAGF